MLAIVAESCPTKIFLANPDMNLSLIHIFPGHGPQTTIGEEREENPFLKK